ncbi:PREDICTED: SUMO-interacting motif-containing protein 1 isoform X1 [Cyprinodon variegatus]|uniref:SUMO interacting motifs containing 1 n=1 Tax=Cyprinodon variegatus TaxID=28743 RepID=A0A3Q2CSV2_CYPVA|nr:PREDICTED: SUMO-interacting motif-containing protein 1 isoform X1 [Cyprinodon variegatus]
MTGVDMDDAISLSSGDSDVEIVGSYGGFKSKPPLSEVRVDVEAVNINIPRHYIDLTDPRWACPELKLRPRLNLTETPVIDLTENQTKETEPETNGCPLNGDSELEQGIMNGNNILNSQDFKQLKNFSEGSNVFCSQICQTPKPKKRCLDFPTQLQKQNVPIKPSQDLPGVKLELLSSLKSYTKGLETSGPSQPQTNVSEQISLCSTQNYNGASQKWKTRLEMTPSLNMSQVDSVVTECLPERMKSAAEGHETPKEHISKLLQDQTTEPVQVTADCLNTKEGLDSILNQHKAIENNLDGFHSFEMITSSTLTSSSQHQTQNKDFSSVLEMPYCSDNPSSFHGGQSPKSDHTRRRCTPELKLETHREDTGGASPISLPWQDESDEEAMNEESSHCSDFRAVSREDRRHVCPITLKKLRAVQRYVLIKRDNENPKAGEVLCRQKLSLVYSTIEENYPEGTLHLLSDLLQPGYYPPKDITTHLLRGILLDPHCPYHLCIQSFNLLMRTQRHHRANRSSVPWDWELLTSIISNQLENAKEQNDDNQKHKWDVMRMLLEYSVQTLEDDFIARCSSSSLGHSIAKATLSCDRQFSRVRDVIKWLFCIIMKTTENEDSNEGIKKKDNQIGIVSSFQRMLCLALEVDRSPALNAAKLSQELFHMVLSHMPQRAHRMLLLESLQSKLLRCKLLEQLLDYACPLKSSCSMSLSLLLHFLKNCTLAADPTDGLERWRKWEELIHLLWMLLLSYDEAMNGYLTSSTSEQIGKGGTLVYKPDDKVSKSAVREAVEAFLSRSKADIGETLPLHVEESLTYLQDHLLDVCQC